jgi:hypothetical protein
VLNAYVVDGAVLTDLEVADALLEAGLAMPLQLVVADLYQAYGEPERHDSRDLERYHFTITSLDGSEIDQACQLCATYQAVSMHEASALALCLCRHHGLLSRSKHLIWAASERGVETHGTLWLLDVLVVNACLAPWEASEAVRTMQARERGLDQRACDRFLAKWDRPPP